MYRNIVFALVSSIFISCCGYSTQSLLPSHLKTIHIAPVENSTLRPLLGEDLGDRLTLQFSKGGRLRVVSESSADLVLNITVTSYSRQAAVYDNERNVQKWIYSLSYRGECRDMVKNSLLWQQNAVVTKVIDSDVDEDESIAKLIDRAAEEIVRKTMIAW